MTTSPVTADPADVPVIATRPSLLRRLGRIAGWAVFFLLLLGFVVFRPVALGGATTYTYVEGVSMVPVLHSGDLAVVVRQDHYRIGDIVSFHPSAAPQGEIIHRIVAGDANAWTTKGDARTDPDPDRTPSSQLVGRAVFIVPGGGVILNALKNPFVLGALAAVLIAWLAWDKLGKLLGESEG